MCCLLVCVGKVALSQELSLGWSEVIKPENKDYEDVVALGKVGEVYAFAQYDETIPQLGYNLKILLVDASGMLLNTHALGAKLAAHPSYQTLSLNAMYLESGSNWLWLTALGKPSVHKGDLVSYKVNLSTGELQAETLVHKLPDVGFSTSWRDTRTSVLTDEETGSVLLLHEDLRARKTYARLSGKQFDTNIWEVASNQTLANDAIEKTKNGKSEVRIENLLKTEFCLVGNRAYVLATEEFYIPYTREKPLNKEQKRDLEFYDRMSHDIYVFGPDLDTAKTVISLPDAADTLTSLRSGGMVSSGGGLKVFSLYKSQYDTPTSGILSIDIDPNTLQITNRTKVEGVGLYPELKEANKYNYLLLDHGKTGQGSLFFTLEQFRGKSKRISTYIPVAGGAFGAVTATVGVSVPTGKEKNDVRYGTVAVVQVPVSGGMGTVARTPKYQVEFEKTSVKENIDQFDLGPNYSATTLPFSNATYVVFNDLLNNQYSKTEKPYGEIQTAPTPESRVVMVSKIEGNTHSRFVAYSSAVRSGANLIPRKTLVLPTDEALLVAQTNKGFRLGIIRAAK